MTAQEAIAKLKSIEDGSFYADRKYSDGTPKLWDTEDQHGDADDILCAFLTALGHEDVVKAWENVPKWYA